MFSNGFATLLIKSEIGMEVIALQIVEARLSELRVNPRNPRRIRPERLAHLQRTLAAEREMLHARPSSARMACS